MNRIFRYEVPVIDCPTISLPVGSQFLHFNIGARGELAVWFLVNDQADVKPVSFRLYGTGHPVDCDPNGWPGHFLGTAVSPPFVWHLFCTSLMHHKNGRLCTGGPSGQAWHLPTCDS